MSETGGYAELNRKWGVTCKVVFGEELGELDDYGEWLQESTRPVFRRKSSVSDKTVSFVLPYYDDRARVASLNEMDFNRKFAPLSINEVKDIDSLLGAVSERICYAGNTQLGNSQFVDESTDIIDSFYIYRSAQISFSKYVAYGYNMEYVESVFGIINLGHCNHSIRISDSDRLTRCFETHSSEESSDLYYSHRLFSCKECLFSFNLRNARHLIGNLQLAPEKYFVLKGKLLPELTQKLRKEKKLPSLMELVGNSEPDKNILVGLGKKVQPAKKKETRMQPMENAFEKTALVLFGRSLKGLERYEKYLQQYIRKTTPGKSAMSRDPLVIADYARYMDYPKNRLLTEQEAEAAGKHMRIEERDLETFDFYGARNWIKKIGFFYPGLDHGEIDNIIESQASVYSTNCFRSMLNMYSKNCAYNFYELESESVFGCNSVRKSSFVIRCCLSAKLTRCFEMDSSRDCSDCYFCHNCENVRDSMFCFNTKNKRYAIGNTELPREEYLIVKKLVLDQVWNELHATGNCHWSIFNLSAEKEKKK